MIPLKKRTTHLLPVIIAFMLCGCAVTDPIHEPTLPTKVTLTTDWSNRTAGIEIPASYWVELNNQTLTFGKATNPLPELEAGTYPLLVYNKADKITISAGTATVETQNQTTVYPTPGSFFSLAQDIVYEVGKEKQVTALMQQQVRQLVIHLTVKEGNPERIATTSATLTGIANSLNLKTNAHSGTNLSVIPIFTRNGDKLTSTVYLLGTTTEPQVLILDITFTDGSTQRIESEVSSMMSNFNTNKHIPLSISANLNTPIALGLEATITSWRAQQDSNGTAW